MAMKDEEMDGKAAAEFGKRRPLVDLLPLTTPLAVDYFLVNACNLSCVFCGHASADEGYKFHERARLDFDVFRKSIDDMRGFAERIKTIHFMGYGEPMLHRRLPDMVAYAVASRVADKVDVISNGIALSRKVADRLVAAGLDWLRISVNGLSAQEYAKNCGAKVDFEKFLDNLRYFYENRGNTRVYVKILDYMVDTDERKGMFHDLFGPISDSLGIEYLGDWVKGIDYAAITGNVTGLSQRGTHKCAMRVCPQPFYMLRINPDGNCTPCCEPRLRTPAESVLEHTVPEIWNGAKFRAFRLAMLDGSDRMSGVCRDCRAYLSTAYPEDVIDGEAERLKPLYG